MCQFIWATLNTKAPQKFRQNDATRCNRIQNVYAVQWTFVVSVGDVLVLKNHDSNEFLKRFVAISTSEPVAYK